MHSQAQRSTIIHSSIDIYKSSRALDETFISSIVSSRFSDDPLRFITDAGMEGRRGGRLEERVPIATLILRFVKEPSPGLLTYSSFKRREGGILSPLSCAADFFCCVADRLMDALCG
ncbi:hypothetical protein TNCV_3662301 [Trichonephila clavipes]|nr:hypothetical protein TNCV_3662301 [Trichonephila clavipes]